MRALSHCAVAAVLLLGLAGCGRKVEPAGSSLNREKARQVAQAASYLVRGEALSVAATGSMRPTLDGNAFIVLERCELGQVRIGDIVVRKIGANQVVHRVVADGPVTQGDANEAPDAGVVTAETFTGRVVCIIYANKNGGD